MTDQVNKKTITISPQTIHRTKGIVILPLKEYQELRERAMATHYLVGKKAEDLDKLVEGGLKEYRNGKCKTIKSLSDLD